MPELPEVETVTNDLVQAIVGLRIERVQILDSRVVIGSPRLVKRQLTGKVFGKPFRRAKAIILPFLSEDFLVVHLRMTGQLIYQAAPSSVIKPGHVRVLFGLDNGACLYYCDQRTFGKLIYCRDPQEISYIANAGPEPLGDAFTLDYFVGAMKKRKAPIKNALLNQHIVAGLGNIYVSEALFASGIHPEIPSNQITVNRLKQLRRQIRIILRRAIANRGTSMRNYRDASGREGEFRNFIKVYGRQGDPCLSCGGPIHRIVQAGRSTFFCPRCQRI